MISNKFGGYVESYDLTKIPTGRLCYPSKNVLVTKGKIITRGGIASDGNASTTNDKVHSEFVWKDALGGQRPIRCTGQKVQVKYNNKWYTIYESLNADVIRVFFATWVDNNGTIVKKRLFFTDNSTALYQWNGAIEKVASFASDTITLDSTDTALQDGFDLGSVTNQGVRVLSLNGSGAVTATNDYLYDNDVTATSTLDLTTTPLTAPVAGDLAIALPTKVTDAIGATFRIDAVYGYQNHIVVANYDSVNMYFSAIDVYVLATGLDFVQPTAGSRTALSPIFMRLDGNFTAMVNRKNVLWISDSDDWYKVTKSVEQNAYDLWVDVEKFETGDNKGALPMAVAKYKGDIIYMAQDKTLQRVTSVEVLGTDEIRQISDDVEALFLRLNLLDIRLYYLERAIYIIAPEESTMIILDLVEGYFQPPQILPINCISVIDGIKYGHHNAVDQTYKLFSGTNDLETPYTANISFGYTHGKHMFRYKQHTMIGVACRISTGTECTVLQQFEEEGAKSETTFVIDGDSATLKKYAVDDDVSWATHPYADRSFGGADMKVSERSRVNVFKKFNAISYFDFRPTFTISGDDVDFHLLGFWVDDVMAKRTIGNDLFVSS